MRQLAPGAVSPPATPARFEWLAVDGGEGLGGRLEEVYPPPTGGVVDGAMVLTARAALLGTRMTVRPQSDGSVRQSGEVTRDGGVTWAAGYDFTYRRR